MPGLGYAKVPGADRRAWLSFLVDYAARRPQLSLLVHLVDGHVGPMETDLAIMRMVRDAAAQPGATSRWRYAVALTKSDKGKGRGFDGARDAVERAVRETGCPSPVAIVATSAKSKAGRHDMWRLLRRVLLPDP